METWIIVAIASVCYGAVGLIFARLAYRNTMMTIERKKIRNPKYDHRHDAEEAQVASVAMFFLWVLLIPLAMIVRFVDGGYRKEKAALDKDRSDARERIAEITDQIAILKIEMHTRPDSGYAHELINVLDAERDELRERFGLARYW